MGFEVHSKFLGIRSCGGTRLATWKKASCLLPDRVSKDERAGNSCDVIAAARPGLCCATMDSKLSMDTAQLLGVAAGLVALAGLFERVLAG